MINIINATPTQLRKAADLQEKIQSLQTELGQLLGAPAETAAIEAPSKRRKVSAAGLANIRAAQKARWAKIKGASPLLEPRKRRLSAKGIANIRAGVAKRMAAQGKAAAPKPAKRVKKHFSPAARAAISAASKARWAKARAAGKTKL